MNKPISNTNALEARTKKNTKYLALWTAVWTLSMALATFGPKFIWHGDTLLTVLAILLNLGLGIGMIVAQGRSLRAQLPFGPFLSVAAMLYLFFGEEIVHRFLPGLVLYPALWS